MGKKSKKTAGRAKAKTGGSSAASAVTSSADSAVAQPVAAAATLTTSATFSAGISDVGSGFEGSNGGGVLAIGGNSRSRKWKCVRCLASLKDLAKAHQCPGCALLYCWRCEKKAFRECLNARNCVKPLRRCMDCTGCKTMAKLSREFPVGDNGILTVDRSVYEGMVELIAKDERVSDAAIPFRICSSPHCLWDKAVIDELGRPWDHPSECYPCASDTDTSRSFYFRKCSQCILMICTMCHDEENKRVLAFASDRKHPASPEEVSDEMASTIPRALFRCQECRQDICITCNLKGAGHGSFTINRNGFYTTCPPCAEKKYWSAKPCTNPACPNEVGVPTKRCGGCHLDRYCSVECQGMAYPAHKARCRAISAKRAAAAGK